MTEKTTGLSRALSERADHEVRAITAVLTELRHSILRELERPSVEQLELFSPAERDQLDRDLASLRARADRIPAEIEQETAAIRERFAEPEPRLFPVAIASSSPSVFAAEERGLLLAGRCKPRDRGGLGAARSVERRARAGRSPPRSPPRRITHPRPSPAPRPRRVRSPRQALNPLPCPARQD
jgi:hypothetical protein